MVPTDWRRGVVEREQKASWRIWVEGVLFPNRALAEAREEVEHRGLTLPTRLR